MEDSLLEIKTNKNRYIKISIGAYLSSYKQFKLNEVRETERIVTKIDKNRIVSFYLFHPTQISIACNLNKP